jgi:hypothetical protein
MQRDLVREKIKVNPSLGRSALLASEHIAIKAARFIQVCDVKSEMKKTVHALQHSSAAARSPG